MHTKLSERVGVSLLLFCTDLIFHSKVCYPRLDGWHHESTEPIPETHKSTDVQAYNHSNESTLTR